MSSGRRVVITGLGVIASNGIGKDAFWRSVTNGVSGISNITSFDASQFTTRFAGEIKDFNPSELIDHKDVKRMDRTSHFAVSAAKMAVADSGLDVTSKGKDRTGVIIGTCMAGHGYILNQHITLRDKGPMRISPYTALASFPDACASQVSIALGISGPSFSISTACSSTTDAVSYACDAIRNGTTDFMIAGGAEASIYPGILAAFCVARAMSQRNDDPCHASRPFDKERDGFVLGEGSGMFILEEYEHAKKRGARIYAEILGSGMTCDAHHMTSPDPEGSEQARAMRMALKNAQVNSEEIDYINAHGTSTVLNDKMETLVIKQVFGTRAYQIPISATKSMVGHLIGAAGSVELAATLLGMEEGIVPPTINYKNPDPECDLDYVPNEARRTKIKIAMKNSFGFGGKNSILILRKI